jgi:RHS repeat-associated protein
MSVEVGSNSSPNPTSERPASLRTRIATPLVRVLGVVAVLGMAGAAFAGYQLLDEPGPVSAGALMGVSETALPTAKGQIDLQPGPCDCPIGNECIPTPRVGFVAPEDGQEFVLGGNVDVGVYACDMFALGGGTSTGDHTSLTVTCPGISLESQQTSITFRPKVAGVCELTVVGSAGPLSRAKAISTSVSASISISIVDSGPSISLTSPLNNAQYGAGNTASLAANATRGSAPLSRVEFEARNSASGAQVFSHTDLTAPYGVNWNLLPVGSFVVTARVIDTAGASAVDSRSIVVVPANMPPAVSIVAPTASSFLAPATINFEAAASDADGSVDRVEFELRNAANNAVVVSRIDGNPPYTVTATSLPLGSYVMNARAFDNSGASTLATKSFSVTSNVPPTVALVTPSQNPQLVILPAGILLNASATDSDGTIQSVEFRHGANGSVLIGQGVAAGGNSYTFNWSGMAAGDYQVIARATDSQGATVDSAARTIRVRANTAPRAAALIRPALQPQSVDNLLRYPDNIFAVGQLMNLEASFQDTEGNFDRVEFYRNSRTPANLLATVRPPSAGATSFMASAEVQLTASLLSQRMQYIFAIAIDSSGAEVETLKAPVAIHTPFEWTDVQTCPAGTANCFPPGESHPIPGLIEAERYDLGGAGVSYFDTDTYSGTGNGGFHGNPRGDDVDVTHCGWNNLYLADSCLISGRRAAEWQTWKVRFSQGGTYGVYICFKEIDSSGAAAGEAKPLDRQAVPLANSIGLRFESNGSSIVEETLQLAPALQGGEVSWQRPEGGEGVNSIVLPNCEGEGQYLEYGVLPYDFNSDYSGRMTLFASDSAWTPHLSLDWVALLPESGGGQSLSVAVSQPLNGATFPFPVAQGIPIQADVFSVGASNLVRFFYSTAQNSNLVQIGSDTTLPYGFQWNPPAIGEYQLWAKVNSTINGVPREMTSDPVRVVVTNAVTNQPPQTVMIQPTGGTFSPSFSVPLRASATDPDGTVSRVEFVVSRNGSPLGSPIAAVADTTAPGQWTASWTAPSAAGAYQLRSRAFDSATPQASGESQSVTVNVQSAPGIAHETPAAIPASIAPASDGVGATAGSFRVDETGAATYSIPLAVVPGRAGVTPELALAYSSQGGLGAMGRGWSISGASAVTRCRQTAEAGDAEALQSGSPPLSFDAKDRYCLDGQRLMLMAGSYDPTAPLMEFRTEIDSFARVRAFNTDGRNGPNYFVVQAKDGTTAWYGDRISGNGLPFMAGFAEVQRADAALRRNQGAGELAADAPILAFALSRRMDSFGNYIDFRYSTDQANGEQWLSTVEFTGKTVLSGQTGNSQATFAYVQFDYSTLPSSEIREAWQAGMRSRASKRLNSIRSYEGMNLVREYRLNYGLSLPRSKESILTSMQECAGSGSSAVCYPATRFEWTLAGNSTSALLPLRSMNAQQNVPRYEKENAKAWQLGDVDGDGRLDVVYFRNVAMGTQLIETLFRDIGSVAAGQFPFRAQGTPVYSLRSYRDLSDAWFLHDFNTDGRDDLMLADVYTSPYYNPNDPVQRARSWRIYPSNGRVPDGAKVFNDSGSNPWLAPCPANDLDAPDCVPVNSGENAQAQLLDVNGDGISDVVYPSPVAGQNELMIKLGSRIAGRPGFSRAYRAVLEQPEDCRQGGAGLSVVCRFAFSSSQSRNGRSPFVFDLNADGRADLWLLANRRVETPCNGGICPEPNAEPDYPTFFSAASKKELDAQIAVNSSFQNARGQGTASTASDSWSYSAQVVDRIDETARQIHFKLYATHGMGSLTPSQKQLFPTDMNLDGLSDVLIATKSGGNYGVQLLMNTGTTLVPVASPLASGGSVVLPEGQMDHMQLVDLNNDGYIDLMYPNGTGSSSTWRLHAGGPAGFGAEETANVQGNVLPGHHTHFFADFDGNGVAEYVRMRHQLTNQSSGEDASYGGLSASSDPGQGAGKPATQIHRIINGYGAETRIVYQPLTNSAVYLREPNFSGEAPGRGSPVHDVFGAMYVVAAVTSDAPGIDAQTRQSTLYYQYAGAKMQAGGRGMLGFRQIRTLDPNFAVTPARHVISITDYGLAAGDYENSLTPGLVRHGFPFTGMPRESRQYAVNAAPNAALIQCLSSGANASSAVCYSGFGSAATVNAFFAEPSGTLLSYARNRLESVVTQNGVGGERSVLAYIKASFEAKGNPETTGAPVTLSETVNHFTYNTAWGDLVASDVGTSTGASFASLEALRIDALVRMSEPSPETRCAGSARCVTRVGTLNTYYPSSQPTAANDRDYWRLGRLQRSTVTHWRQGVHGEQPSSLTRESRFEYELGSAARTGALTVERVAGLSTLTSATAPNGSASELRTLRLRDAYGNVTDTFVCSGDVSDLACQSPSEVLQRPAGTNGLPLTRVHRHTRSEYDSQGRYPVRALSPHFDGSSDGAMQALETVQQRDALGNVLQTNRLNGGSTSATYGPLGRQQTSTDSTGAKSASEFHWCGGGSATGQVAACPSDIGAVFRQTSYSYGGTRSVTYFDRLGREVFALSEGFNQYDNNASNDWVGVCKTYDGRGRTVAVTEPFFVGNVAFNALRPELSTAVDCATRARTRTTYDELDRALTILLPEHGGSTTAMSQMVYAGLQTTTTTRLSRATSPFVAPTVVELSEVKLHDATGQVLSVTDAEGLVANYAHDAAGNLIALKRDAGRGEIVSRISYDALGRKTSQNDPDAGTASYAYNAAGELICSQDARGYATITDFDALGRGWRSRTLKSTCVSTTTTAVTPSNSEAWVLPAAAGGDHSSVDLTVYDLAGNGIGQVERTQRKHRVGSTYAGYRGAAADQGEFEQVSSYDSFGRPRQATTRFREPNLSGAGLILREYTQSTTYDALGRVATSQDATGGVVENMYSAHGFLRRVRDAGQPSLVFWELLETDVRGQTTLDRRHGKVELTQQREYNAVTGRLARIVTGTWANGQVSSAVQNLSYIFDAQGNLLSRKDERANGREEVFIYDRLNRLIEARLNGTSPAPANGLPTLTLSYDKLGNICSKNGVGYSYAGRAGCGLNSVGGSGGTGSTSPHAVTARGTLGYQYDLAGNMTTTTGGTHGTRSVRFDGAGNADRLAISTQSTSFWYAGGGRYLRLDESSEAPAKLTRYLGSVEWILRSNGAEERKRNIGGFLLLTETGDQAAPTRKYRYLLADHLGSTDTLVDENGVVRERMSFDAHGSRRSADSGTGMWASLLPAVVPTDINPQVNAETTRGFTGHEHIDRMGLVHMNGRLYDPLLGRMLSPDPIVQEPYNAQNLNRYSYVLNNPLSYTDPSGLSFVKKYWRQILVAAISIFVPPLGAWGAVTMGAVSGYISTGTLEGALIGGFSAGVFWSIGQAFQSVNTGAGTGFAGTGFTEAQFAGKVLAHATTGGVMSVLQGGKFGHGFASAGISQAAVPATHGVQSMAARTMIHATIGGTASVASGGKFANGAVTAAMAFAYNDRAHAPEEGAPEDVFRRRADRYREMHQELQGMGIDTVWFEAAANLNDYFVGAFPALGPSQDYLIELGGHLAAKNEQMFSDVKAGYHGRGGLELDFRLVRLEQAEVTRFNRGYFANRRIPDGMALGMLAAFTQVGALAGNSLSTARGGPWAAQIHAGISRSNRVNGSSSFWMERDRVQIGYGIMDHIRKSR